MKNLVIRICVCSCLMVAGLGAFAQTTSTEAKKNDLWKTYQNDKLQNNVNDAYKHLLTFIEQFPEEAAGYYEMASIHLYRKNYDEAKSFVEKAIALDNDNKWYKERLIEVLLEQKQFEEAAEWFVKLAEQEKKDEKYRQRAISAFLATGQYKKAIEQLEKIIAKHNYSEQLTLELGRLYISDNQLDQAERTFQSILEKNPFNDEAVSGLIVIKKKQNKAAEADKLLKEAIDKFPNSILFQAELLARLKEQGKIDEGLAILKRIVNDNKVDVSHQMSLYMAFTQDLDSSHNKAVFDIGDLMYTNNPNDQMAIVINGNMHYFVGNYDTAAERYKKSLQLNRSTFEVWQQLLFCYTNIKYADSLIKYSEEALVIFPNHSIFHHLNGIGYYNKKDYSSAQASFNRALEVEVTDNKALQAEIYSLLADTYYHTKDYKLSDTHFDKAIALDPQNPVIKNNYAYYLSERNQRLDFAKELSEQSLKISPDEASFLDTYGWILYQLGDYKKAETYVIKAIEKSGEDVSSTLLEHLGDIHFKLNKLSDAIKHWEMALEKDPDNNSLKEKLKTKAVK